VRLHGLPEAISAIEDTSSTAHLFQQLWTAFGTDLRLSTAYHPQSDGGTERLIRELEQQLRAHANRAGNNWKQWLPIVESTKQRPTRVDREDSYEITEWTGGINGL